MDRLDRLDKLDKLSFSAMSPEREVTWFEINNKKVKIRNKEVQQEFEMNFVELRALVPSWQKTFDIAKQTTQR